MSERYHRLVSLLEPADRVAVAFSGGVDSALVAAAAVDADVEAMAITVTSPVFASWQCQQASAVAQEIGIRHVFVDTDMLPPAGTDRCYRCKQHMARQWKETAAKHGYTCVADGVTATDLADPRLPGARAATQAGIWHPLAELEVSEAAVRKMARWRDLSVWDAPSEACLASRLPPEEPVTREKLRMIEAAEEMLRDLSARVRVRCHADIARIEVPSDACAALLQRRQAIAARLRHLGFRYVTLDLEGFRHGSMHR